MFLTRFNKYLPSPSLQPYVQYFAIAENLSQTAYTVLPNTSLVMGFQYQGRLLETTGEKECTLSTAGVTGLQRQAQLFKNNDSVGTVLVYFSVTGAASFFGHPLHDFFDDNVPLDCLFPTAAIASFQERLSAAPTDVLRIQRVEQFLISLLQPTASDLLVTTALQHIYQSKGTVRMKRLAEMLYTSQSPLEKRFRKAVGASPKVFASIVRFQTLIRGHSSTESLTQQAYAAGYYDQAHFIKDFKSFTGQTPEQFFLHR